MKIENGKFVFEEVTCWDCKGTKIVTRYTLCPLNNQAVNRQPNRQCPHCKAKNKYSHQTVGSYQTDCTVCSATGKIMEDLYSYISKEQWAELHKSFKFNIRRVNREANFNESYLGLGYLYGCTDWGTIAKKSDEEILKFIPTDGHPIQPVGWCKKDGTVPLELDIVVRNDGYGVWPKWYVIT